MLRKTNRAATLLHFLILSTLGAPFTASCSSSNSSSASSANALVLDPTQPHYGNSDDQWGGLWWQWVYQLPQTDAKNCYIPFQDATGANCGDNQSGPVFFLAGTTGGTVVRDACVVPLGKAIFFPILTFTADNAGVPATMQLTNMALQMTVQMQTDAIPVSGLSAEFDGVAITNLGRFRTTVGQFSYTLPPEPNIYTCEGSSGVTGLITPAYESGYYIMLSPPAAGPHVLHFAGSSPTTKPPLMVDVTYNFKVM